jgi:tetratricopeptide (TPR) repeat protein
MSPGVTSLLTVAWMLIASAIAPWAMGQDLQDAVEIRRIDDVLDERQDDQVEAMALYSHARVLLERGDVANALRRYQRAWRFDPDLVSVVKEILPLAVSLKRNAEITAYILLIADSAEVPPDLLLQVAVVATREGDLITARRLYQAYLQRRGLRSNNLWKPENLEDLTVLLEHGRLALLLGEFATAADAFMAVRDVLRDDQPFRLSDEDRARLLDQPELVYSLMGEGFLQAERWDAAKAMYQEVNRLQSDAGLLAFRLARLMHRRGDDEAAREQLNKYFSLRSDAAREAAYQLLAELYDPGKGDSTGDAEPAIRRPSRELLDRLGELLSDRPDDPVLAYFLADQLLAAERLQDAEQLYLELLDRLPATEGFTGLVDIYHRRGQIDLLLDRLVETMDKTGGLAALGAVVAKLADDPPCMEQLSNAAKKRLPQEIHSSSAALGMTLAWLHGQAGNSDQLKFFLNEAMKREDPRRGEYAIELAFRLFDLEDPASAAAPLEAVLDRGLLKDKESQLYYLLASAWTLTKDFARAQKAARRAAQLDPQSSATVSRLAWVQYAAEELEASRTSYVQLLDRFDSNYESPENRQIMRDARLTLSTIDALQDRNLEAEQWLQEVLDEFPEDIGALNDLGYLWVDQGMHLQRSLRMIQQAVEAEPENAAYRDSLGWALYQLQRYDEAVQELRRAAAAEPPDGLILDHLGDALLKTKQTQQAIDTWQRAVDILRAADNLHDSEEIQTKIDQHASRSGSDVQELQPAGDSQVGQQGPTISTNK